MGAAFYFFFGLLANLASLLGVGFSVAAWRSAKTATTAAREARDTIRKGAAAEDLQALGEKAKEFLRSVENDAVPIACLRATDIVSETSKAKHRWGRFMELDSLQSLDSVREQISVISRSQASKGAPTTPAQKDRLLRFCHTARLTLNEEWGKLMSEIERQGE